MKRHGKGQGSLVFWVLASSALMLTASAAIEKPDQGKNAANVNGPVKSAAQSVKLKSHEIRQKISKLETALSFSEKKVNTLRQELDKLERLLKLQELEIELGEVEVEELELELQELEIRRISLEESIALREAQIREALAVIYSLKNQSVLSLFLQKNYQMQSYLKQTISKLMHFVRDELQMIESLYAEQLSLKDSKIKRKEDLQANIEGLVEKKKVLELNRSLKLSSIQRNKKAVSRKIRSIRRAKTQEAKMKRMLRASQQKATESEAKAADGSAVARRALGKKARADLEQQVQDGFAALKGSLPWPVRGKIVSKFGKKYDKATSLYTFHKGIDVKTAGVQAVQAVHDGTVVFSGRLGGYGELTIVDHGNRYFSLLGNLGVRLKKEGDKVVKGEVVGQSLGDGTPVYIEIRRRHIAVNPLPWFANSGDVISALRQ